MDFSNIASTLIGVLVGMIVDVLSIEVRDSLSTVPTHPQIIAMKIGQKIKGLVNRIFEILTLFIEGRGCGAWLNQKRLPAWEPFLLIA